MFAFSSEENPLALLLAYATAVLLPFKDKIFG